MWKTYLKLYRLVSRRVSASEAARAVGLPKDAITTSRVAAVVNKGEARFQQLVALNVGASNCVRCNKPNEMPEGHLPPCPYHRREYYPGPKESRRIMVWGVLMALVFIVILVVNIWGASVERTYCDPSTLDRFC